MTAFEKLKDIYKTDEAIAKALNATRQCISLWKIRGIPLRRAKQIQKVTKGKVTIMDVING